MEDKPRQRFLTTMMLYWCKIIRDIKIISPVIKIVNKQSGGQAGSS